MKLSKEKHTRSAVANNGDIKSAEVNNGNTKSEEVNNGDIRSAVANEEQNIGGILYRFPGKSIDGVKDQMLRRDKEVKKLYNVFNQIQVGTKPKKWNNDEKLSPEENERRAQQKNIKMKNYKWREACSKYVESSQRIINDVIFYSYRKAENKLRYMRKNEDILKKMQEAEKLSKFSGGKLEDFVAYTLRKSLVVSKYDTQEFDSVAAMVVFLECIGKNNISDHEREIVCKLLELIRKDFSKLDPNVKGSQGANIVRSVRNQNMIVQPQGDRFLFPQVYAKENETVTNLALKISDKDMNQLLHRYLYIFTVVDDKKTRKTQGIIQGSSLSPLFSNVYMADFDKYLESKYSFCRFSDNINIYCASEEEAYKAFNDVTHWLQGKLGLKYNHDKSGVYPSLDRRYLGYDFKWQRGTNTVSVCRHNYEKPNYFGSWHCSAIQKIDRNYHIINDGVLNKKDFTILIENDEHKMYIPIETCTSTAEMDSF